MQKLLSHYQDAVALLHQLTTPHGILASTLNEDNYKRVWARDSIVCGLAGLYIKDAKLIEGLKQSLITLSKNQHPVGMIPSNVFPQENEVSYGSLIGRIDACTWFIIGCCEYFLNEKDLVTWKNLLPAVKKTREYLKAVEFNGKGWVYTPISGNWADEYPIHGYTLYDNALRIWGELLWEKITGNPSIELENIITKTKENFWPSISEKQINNIYHKETFQKVARQNPLHFSAFILPGIYDTRFDAAAHAIALQLFTLSKTQKEKLEAYVNQLPLQLIPAFWPVITEKSDDYNLLIQNFSYQFKNTPGNFHNGGVWPVWMGLFCLGLSKNGMQPLAKKIINAFESHFLGRSNWDFQEYLNPLNVTLGGKSKMGYTASGMVFMKLAIEDIYS